MFTLQRKKNTILGAGLLGALAVGLTPAPASAATATTTFQVTATVVATCLISGNTLAFGNYTGVQLDGTTTL